MHDVASERKTALTTSNPMINLKYEKAKRIEKQLTEKAKRFTNQNRNLESKFDFMIVDNTSIFKVAKGKKIVERAKTVMYSPKSPGL